MTLEEILYSDKKSQPSPLDACISTIFFSSLHEEDKTNTRKYTTIEEMQNSLQADHWLCGACPALIRMNSLD